MILNIKSKKPARESIEGLVGLLIIIHNLELIPTIMIVKPLMTFCLHIKFHSVVFPGTELAGHSVVSSSQSLKAVWLV